MGTMYLRKKYETLMRQNLLALEEACFMNNIAHELYLQQ